MTDLIERESFLDSIKSKSGKYKRVSDTPMRYAGGKSLAVGLIAEHLPSNVKNIVSPFIGGGSFEVAVAKRLGINVQGYDVFDLLVNYWQVQVQKPKDLAIVLSSFEASDREYREVKAELKAHWLGETLITDSVRLAALYFFNHNTSYGPGFLGWGSSVYLQPERWLKMIDKVSSFNVPNLQVEQASFTDSIANAGESFIYADPPYFLEGDSKMFKGIYPQRNFPIHHNNFAHETLRDLLHNHKGGFVLSYNDCSTIREWYSDFEILAPSWQYTMGQGEVRIGKNRLDADVNHVKKSHELLIVKRG